MARNLSDFLINHPIDGIEIVVAGGFEDGQKVVSSDCNTSLVALFATHEEADTRVILHAVQSPYSTVVVSASDRDILLLLIYHYYQSKNQNDFWMMTGTKNNRKYVPIREIVKSLPAVMVQNILAFHAITGSDSTSHIAGIGKPGAFAVYEKNAHLLTGLGVHPLTEECLQKTEEFVVKLYKLENVKTFNEARHKLFAKVRKAEFLPPTSDALKQHILRSHYQVI